MSNEPLFPISVRFEGGEVETYSDVSHLECDLEVFDSEQSPGCEVVDALGRRVKLRISHGLELEELSLLDTQ